jgi:hypothetical protein
LGELQNSHPKIRFKDGKGRQGKILRRGIEERGRKRDFIRDFCGMEEMDMECKSLEKQVCILCVILEDG